MMHDEAFGGESRNRILRNFQAVQIAISARLQVAQHAPVAARDVQNNLIGIGQAPQ